MSTPQPKNKAVIIGAGPAGLTAALELLRQSEGVQPVVVEKANAVGGLSQTICYKGNRMDIGGHRFFSKSSRVNDFWKQLMPIQGAPAEDDILTDTRKDFVVGGPNPEESDCVMLLRRRVSRIYWQRRFFNYPVSLTWRTLANLGLWRTIKVVGGYLKARVIKKPEISLENFYINRFGRPLYSYFFENYTEKVWGVHPSNINADWGMQRVKGLSIHVIIKEMLRKSMHLKKKGKVETSLIEEFLYPKLGPGQMWETAAQEVQQKGGILKMQNDVTAIHIDSNRHVDWVETTLPDGSNQQEKCNFLLSSMPLKELITVIKGIDIPDDIRRVADNLPYRDFITVGLLVKKLKITNQTRIPTYANRIPDTWIYLQERDVKVGRLQIFNNWSPYLIHDFKNTMWIGLEYFCNEGDELWNMSEEEFIRMATSETEALGLIDPQDVIDFTMVKMPKAYPAYFGSYYELDKVRKFLETIPNLYCIGRNGQHRYNNMDHSMLTAMKAADAICSGSNDKQAVWSVNTEDSYHEGQ